MNVEQTNQFADFVEKKMFRTSLQIALVKDIRAGVYSNGNWSLAKLSLITALMHIKAPTEVIDHVRAMKIDSRAQAEQDQLIADAQAFFASKSLMLDFVVPVITNEMLDAANEHLASALVPDSNFMDELTRESDERAKRIVASDNSDSSSIVLTAQK